MKSLSRAVTLTLFLLLLPPQSTLAELLIVEVQIYGESVSGDFIKIYNPTAFDIYLENYQDSYVRLVKRTKTGTKDVSIKSWSKDADAVIPAGRFYVWANNNYAAVVQANAATSQSIAANNGVALRLGPENTGAILDAVGWGDFNNVLFESGVFPENPGPGQQLKRKVVGDTYQDTNNNSQDFYLYPSPPAQSTQTPSTAKTEPTPKTSESTEIDLNTASLKDLQKLAGIGPTLAQRIIDARPFYSVDDLAKVRNIGPKTLADIKTQGLAWVDPALQPPRSEGLAGIGEKGVAAVAQPIGPQYAGQSERKPLPVFPIALAVALFSAAAVFALKKKLKPKTPID